MVHSARRGFTLVELMIVLVILGVLSSIAIPSYHDYIKRAKVAELITYASSAKVAVSEYIVTHHKYPENLTSAGVHMDSSQYVRRISLEPDGLLLVEGNKKSIGADVTLSFKADEHDSHISWTCAAISGTQYAPVTCR